MSLLIVKAFKTAALTSRLGNRTNVVNLRGEKKTYRLLYCLYLLEFSLYSLFILLNSFWSEKFAYWRNLISQIALYIFLNYFALKKVTKHGITAVSSFLNLWEFICCLRLLSFEITEVMSFLVAFVFLMRKHFVLCHLTKLIQLTAVQMRTGFSQLRFVIAYAGFLICNCNFLF